MGVQACNPGEGEMGGSLEAAGHLTWPMWQRQANEKPCLKEKGEDP